MADLHIPVHAVDTCCGRSVIRADASPGGVPVALDVEPVQDGPAAFVVTVDGRVIVWPEANPKYTGRRHRVHQCAADGGDRG